jgi:hypothetical protein
MTEACCDCIGSPPWLAMIHLHAGGLNRYYLWPECGAVKEDVYQGRAIVEHRCHNAPDGTLPRAVREEALEICGGVTEA